MVDAAQEGRFARAGRPEDNHDLARSDVKIDPFQDFKLVEGLVNIACMDERFDSCKGIQWLASCAMTGEGVSGTIGVPACSTGFTALPERLSPLL